MTRHSTTVERRSEAARSAWSALDHGGHGAAALHIQCEHGHHVGVVFDTAEGLVFRAPVRARSHGSRDRVDEVHGSGDIDYFFDFLEGGADAGDELPAWCDCGPRVLSRSAVAGWVGAHEKRVVID